MIQKISILKNKKIFFTLFLSILLIFLIIINTIPKKFNHEYFKKIIEEKSGFQINTMGDYKIDFISKTIFYSKKFRGRKKL